MSANPDIRKRENLVKDIQIIRQGSNNYLSKINITPIEVEKPESIEKETTSAFVMPTQENMADDIPPDVLSNDSLARKNCQLREEIIRLRCNFEAERFSLQYYASKIEKELQQILFENHYLRQKMNKINNIIGSLTKIVKKSSKMYLAEREYPPENREIFDSCSDSDFNDPKFLPIEELQDKIQQLLDDYRENISLF